MDKEILKSDGDLYERVTRQAAHKLYTSGRAIWLLPHGVRFDMGHQWIVPCRIHQADDVVDGFMDRFGLAVKHYEWYNNNIQLGRYTKFYRKVLFNRPDKPLVENELRDFVLAQVEFSLRPGDDDFHLEVTYKGHVCVTFHLNENGYFEVMK